MKDASLGFMSLNKYYKGRFHMKCFRKALLPLAISLALLSSAQAAPKLTTETSSLSYIQQVAATNAWVEIDKATFESNLAAVQARLQGKSQVCAVMKADAYGHGIGLLLPSVIAMNVPCIAITSNEEARVVRAHGFTGRLMHVRTPTLAEVESALPYDVEELVGGLDFARMAGEIAIRHGKTLRIHLGLNSAGMSRNGLEMGTEQGREDAFALVKQGGAGDRRDHDPLCG
ncbi:alanine racemase [Pseudomonas putida]